LLEGAAPATSLGLCQQCLNLLRGGCHLVDFDFLIDCELLQVEADPFLSYRIEKLEVSWFELLSRGVFLNASTRYSVKYLRGSKLLFEPFFIVDLARGLANTVSCFRCGP
jgi:hypothetical protein